MLRSGKYGYLDDLHRRIQDLGDVGFDFFDPNSIGTNECEYMDGIHGGPVMWARILRQIADKSDDKVKALIDTATINTTIERYAGRVTIEPAIQATGSDLAKLGCSNMESKHAEQLNQSQR